MFRLGIPKNGILKMLCTKSLDARVYQYGFMGHLFGQHDSSRKQFCAAVSKILRSTLVSLSTCCMKHIRFAVKYLRISRN